MIRRFSSRHGRLEHVFLRERLRNARRYDRIAGYFRSSLLELIHEELTPIDQVRVVCNSDLDPRDISAARTAEQQAIALREKWAESAPPEESILGRDRYRRLYELLIRGNLQVRVVGRTNAPFVHGKAGFIEGRDGSRTAFIGSNNETREGWREHYELLWEDDSAEAVAWVCDEFDFLWSQGVPLPRAVIEEIDRCARRVEYSSIEACPSSDLAAAAMAEAPLYSRGESLMPWQQTFVGMFLEHRERFGKARFLLADEVGVGKTLSLATSAVLASLLGDGPALILCPANLTEDWQVELWDKLGVPSAVWTPEKTWLDHTGHHIRTRGPEDIARCPYQIGIVSTGLIFRLDSEERKHLLGRSLGTLVLDEAHRARRAAGRGRRSGEANNLLAFMRDAAKNARHVLLGTATPIQTDVRELWDLLDVLGMAAEHVFGRPQSSRWRLPERVLEFITGTKAVEDEGEVWDLIRNPLPPRNEDALFDHIRTDLGMEDSEHFTSRPETELAEFTRAELFDRLTERHHGLQFFQRHNPFVRHTVLRKRATLEDRGLLPRIAVDIHPHRAGEKSFFSGLALLTNEQLDRAYAAVKRFTDLFAERNRAAGFLHSLLLQRLCSSLASGLSTARRLLGESDDGPDDERIRDLTEREREALEDVVEALKDDPIDPKFEAVHHYLVAEQWIRYGCIIFSQYYDTSRWIADELATKLPGEPIALYAGADRSRLLRDGRFVQVHRDTIKAAVKKREIRLVVATDAACEGLNLQTLGTLINIDLPWNPSRLEQRVGRIRRLHQVRDSVDVLNLVYSGTLDEKVYQRLSKRMKNRFDIFGSLPDVIEDEWIENIETLDTKLDEYIEKKRRANAFDIRYADTVEPNTAPWERCAQVLSRRDIVERMSRGW